MLASVHRARGFLQSVARAPSGQGPLEAVAVMTSACMAAGGLADEQSGTWAAEACDMLLDTWVELLYERSAGFSKYALAWLSLPLHPCTAGRTQPCHTCTIEASSRHQ